jgi:hypothetical protein
MIVAVIKSFTIEYFKGAQPGHEVEQQPTAGP